MTALHEWLFDRALRVAAILAVGYVVAWVLGDAFWYLPPFSLAREWIPLAGIRTVLQQTAVLTAALYVIREGTAGET